MNIDCLIPGCSDCKHFLICKEALDGGVCLYGPKIHRLYRLMASLVDLENVSIERIDEWTSEAQKILIGVAR